jgi:hypothetical protein
MIPSVTKPFVYYLVQLICRAGAPLLTILQLTLHNKKIFQDRFVLYMLAHSGTYLMPNGRPVLQYATKVAPSYWKESRKYNLTPEELAESDMSYWPVDFGISQQAK